MLNIRLCQLGIVICGVGCGWTGSSADEPNRQPNTTLTFPAKPPPESYRLENAFAGISFSQPVAVRTPPGETNRLFVVEKAGRIQVIPDLATPTKTVFLDLSGVVTTSGEQGLLSMAFHPNYAANGTFFVFYTLNISGLRHDRVARFQVSAIPDIANAASEQPVLDQRDQAGNHNGGDMHFGPDGYLYISLGDEGGGGDSYNNSQRIDKDYFSGILRIDVDQRPGSLPPNLHPTVVTNGLGEAHYAVPADNPWVGVTSFNGLPVNPADVITEFWAVGLRNPWRMSFDPLTGELWCGDVGQGTREEIDLIRGGHNYGWDFREGFIAYNGTPPSGFVGTDPIHDYPRTEGQSVTGGVVYRGDSFSSLYGAYVFADYASGKIWALRRNGSVTVDLLSLDTGIAGIGADPRNGDILLCDISAGQVKRMVASSGGGQPLPPTLAATGAFSDLASLTPHPGIVDYAPNVNFWSDHAVKRRWFSVPELTDTMTFSRDAPWDFPAGTVWIKHFDLELERGNPASARRTETRFLVKTASGSYGAAYVWDQAQTHATLAPAGGLDIDYEILDGGIVHTQTWRVPGRADCITCHTPAAGHALSFDTRQLNRDCPMGGGSNRNQLHALQEAGYFDASLPELNSLPWYAPAEDTTQSLEFRVRSYLAVNCVQCHLPGGSAPNTWDARATVPLSKTRIVEGLLNNPGGDAANRVVAPGDPAHSMLLQRLTGGPGLNRMPPLGSNEIDLNAVALLTDWIQTEATHVQTYAQWQISEFGSTNHPLAARTIDADQDFAENQLEYLTQTDPNDSNDVWRIGLSVTGATARIAFDRAPNTGFTLERSLDLFQWTPWEVASNRPTYSATSQPAVIEGDAVPRSATFRIRVYEP